MPKATHPAPIRAALVALLMANGFVKKNYPSDEGDFYLKTMRLGDMPYMKEHACNSLDGLSEDSLAQVEVMPGESVQMFVPEDDYREEPQALAGDGTGRGILVDAGVPADAFDAAMA